MSVCPWGLDKQNNIQRSLPLLLRPLNPGGKQFHWGLNKQKQQRKNPVSPRLDMQELMYLQADRGCTFGNCNVRKQKERASECYNGKQVPFYPQHFSLIQLGLVWMMSLNPHACPISTQRKSHIHTFWVILTPHSVALSFQPLPAHYIGFSGTCILESQWLSLTPHNITSSHSWLISSHNAGWVK